MAKDGHEIELDWSYLEFPWRQDPEIEKALEANYPFRPSPEPKVVYRYPSEG